MTSHRSSTKSVLKTSCMTCNILTYSYDSVSCSICNRDSSESENFDMSVEILENLLGEPDACCICIRRGKGSFFKAYSQFQSLLHVGVSNSKGMVYNFDEHGLRCDSKNQWPETLSIALNIDSALEQQFDQDLEQCMENFLSFGLFAKYHPISNNCYSFVVELLNQIKWSPSLTNVDQKHTKESLVMNHISLAVEQLETFLQISERLYNQKFATVRIDQGNGPKVVICDICDKTINLHRGDVRYKCTSCEDYDVCSSCFELDFSHDLNHEFKAQN